MLSIAKLAAGGQRYYLDQAKGRVSHERSVASGVEDYYLSGPEAAGRWTGTVAERAGLRDARVSEDGLHRALSWSDPQTGDELEGPVQHARVPGFDLMFSVPKSASVLFGIGSPRVQGAIRDAQREAVAEAMRYLERTAARTRLGRGGQLIVEGRGLLAAAFEHRTSRAGDPQLHTHVLVANAIERPDGLFGTLDGRAIYAEARTAGFVHEAAFRQALTAKLGVEWRPVVNGIADIDGVDDAVLDAFSRRSKEIDEQVQAWGTSTAAARQSAAVKTRAAKDYGVTPDRLAPEWRARGDALGLTPTAVDQLIDRVGRERLNEADLPALRASLLGSAGLTAHAAHFDRRDVVRAVAESAQRGATLDEIDACADALLVDPRVVSLRPNGAARRSDVIRLKDGRAVTSAEVPARYSTQALLAAEQRVVSTAVSRADEQCTVAAELDVAQALARRPTIGPDQAAMIRRVTRSGAGVDVVVGPAGTGKTFALDAAREAWQASGFHVMGASVVRAAARNLQDSTGIESTSVTSLLQDLRRGGAFGLSARTVVVIDEAGMLGTRQLAELVERSATARAKLVLIGDHRQLPEIDAGGAFRALATRLPCAELTENRRQPEPADRERVDHLRHGRAGQALRIARDRGDLILAPTAEATHQRLVEDYLAARSEGHDTLMIALRRTDVAALNHAARAHLDATGQLGPERLSLGGREFAAGDVVVCKKNDRRLAVANGTLATITAIHTDSQAIDIQLPSGAHLRLDRAYLSDRTRRREPTLEHAYAATAHIAQGLTTDQAFVLGSDAVYAEWAYVALSRARHRTSFYICEPDLARIEPGHRRRDQRLPLERELSRTHRQMSALDSALHAELAGLSPQELAAKREQVASRLTTSQPTATRPTAAGRLAEARATEAQARAELDAHLAQRKPWHRNATPALAEATAVQRLARARVRTLEAADIETDLSPPPSEQERSQDRATLAAIDDALAAHDRRNEILARHCEPPYVRNSLGERPEPLGERTRWDRAVRLIERYRARCGISDPSRPFGAEPTNPTARAFRVHVERRLATVLRSQTNEHGRDRDI